ncbi:MAG: CDP-glucose 4,6-dehydratase [Magnetococcales bacterium]|nr:CDP-glucose 4,6-dehydratase [Magnetococcales bacterium]
MITPVFWQGKRVLVTGHTGFMGGWLTLWLAHLGARVTGYALAPPSQPNLFEVARVADGVRHEIGDIGEAERLQRLVQEVQPEVVFHLAAQPLVRYSYQAPVETYASNVMGTLHVLEAIRHAGGVRAAVLVTTDKCYENNGWHWGYREIDRLGGHDPYSSSKAAAEILIGSYRHSYFTPGEGGTRPPAIASVRVGNIIGGGDWATDRLIPDIMRSFSKGEPVLIRNPAMTRPWQHVLEPLRGYLMLAEQLCHATDGHTFAEAWNFGPDDSDAKPVIWIVEQLVKRWGEGAAWTLDQGAHPHEATLLKLDSSKAKARLKWFPAWNLDQVLTHTLEWYRRHGRREDMRAVCMEQIASYQEISSRHDHA